MLHQRRLPFLLVSRKSQLQPSLPGHSFTRAASSAVSRSTADRTTGQSIRSSASTSSRHVHAQPSAVGTMRAWVSAATYALCNASRRRSPGSDASRAGREHAVDRLAHGDGALEYSRCLRWSPRRLVGQMAHVALREQARVAPPRHEIGIVPEIIARVDAMARVHGVGEIQANVPTQESKGVQARQSLHRLCPAPHLIAPHLLPSKNA